MLDFERKNQQRGESMTSREMPCLMLRSQSNDSWPHSGVVSVGCLEGLADLRARKEGFLLGGLLMPLGWREFLATDDVFPRVVDGDEWEEDDDVVDDDDDDEEEEEDEDDFFPGDGDEFEEEDDDDDEEDEEEE